MEPDAAKRVYWNDVMEPCSGGRAASHFAHLAALLARNGGGEGWAVGERPSIADVLLFDICDL